MSTPEMRTTHKYLHARLIFIGLPISDELASDVIDALACLEKKNSDPAAIYINSPGGIAAASERIIVAIEQSPLMVNTHCLGRAAGTATHIFAMGRRRTAVRTALISFEDFSGNNRAGDFDIEEGRKRFMRRTSTALGVSEQTVVRWTFAECGFTGQALIDLGIAHELT